MNSIVFVNRAIKARLPSRDILIQLRRPCNLYIGTTKREVYPPSAMQPKKKTQETPKSHIWVTHAGLTWGSMRTESGSKKLACPTPYLAASPFIFTISYSPAPSRPLPLPRPREKPCSSSPSSPGPLSPSSPSSPPLPLPPLVP